jgi:hypothetical protein
VRGLGLEDLAGESPQSGSRRGGGVQDQLLVQAGTVTRGAGISALSESSRTYFAVFPKGPADQDRLEQSHDRIISWPHSVSRKYRLRVICAAVTDHCL